jgi:hypothetical protein
MPALRRCYPAQLAPASATGARSGNDRDELPTMTVAQPGAICQLWLLVSQ